MTNGAILAMVWTFVLFVPMVLRPLPDVVARVYSGWFLGLALLLWLAGRSGDWRELRLPSLWLLALPGLLLAQLLRFPDRVAWTHPALLATGADLVALAVAAGALWLRHHGTGRRLAAVGALGSGLFLAALVAMPVLRPDLDVRAAWVGDYARGPFGALMTVAYLALGTGALALGLALRRIAGLRAGGTLLALAAAGAYVSAAFQQAPPGTRTTAGTVREIALVPTFALLVAALALLVRGAFRHPAGRPLRWPALALFGVVLVSFAVALAAPEAWKGIAGRGFDAAWTLWMAGAAMALLRSPGLWPIKQAEEGPAWTTSSPWSSTTRAR
jgi:hypothetical protein